MKGFTKITFGEDGSSTKIACSICGKISGCFCVHDLQQSALPDLQRPALPPSSPAASVLSVSVTAGKSPTFSFQPWSGYGNVDGNDDAVSLPPEFSLDAPSPERSCGPFFSGGSPTWLFDGWTFVLSDNGGVHRARELQKLIERHGGACSERVHRGVDLLIADEQDVAAHGRAVRKARERGVPVVPASFLHDSLAEGEACDFTRWQMQPPPAAPQAVLPAVPHSAPAATRFNWRRAIAKQLKSASGGALRRRRLREAVLADCRRQGGGAGGAGTAEEEAALRARFRRALHEARDAGRLLTEGRQVRIV